MQVKETLSYVRQKIEREKKGEKMRLELKVQQGSIFFVWLAPPATENTLGIATKWHLTARWL